MSTAAQASRPTIYVTESDFEQLSGLARATAERVAGGALLAEELERAVIVREGDSPRRFVRMYSKVTYEDVETGQQRTVELVLPEEADIDKGRISIVTPVGAALIGLTPGKRFTFASGGRERRLRVVEVADGSPPQ